MKRNFILLTFGICIISISSCRKKLGGMVVPTVPSEVAFNAPWLIMPKKVGTSTEISYEYTAKVYTTTSQTSPVGVAVKHAKNGNQTPTVGIGQCNCTSLTTVLNMNFPEASKYYYVNVIVKALDCYWPTKGNTTSATLGGKDEFEAVSPIFDAPQNVFFQQFNFNYSYTIDCL